MAKWPAVITEDMWTFALCHSVNFHNSSVRKGTYIAPFEAFTVHTPPWSFHDCRVFGSPTYVHQKEPQEGTSYIIWKAQA